MVNNLMKIIVGLLIVIVILFGVYVWMFGCKLGDVVLVVVMVVM